jgi:hypothetical protein
MKKSLIILTLIFFVFNLKSQQLKKPKTKFSSANYLKKSNKQRTTGFVLLGGGVTTFTGGAISMRHSTSKGERETRFILAGMGMAVTSIPFFILSASNKHKSKLELKRNPLVGSSAIEKNIYQTSISLKIIF